MLGHFGHGHFGHGRFGQDISATDISAMEKNIHFASADGIFFRLLPFKINMFDHYKLKKTPDFMFLELIFRDNF